MELMLRNGDTDQWLYRTLNDFWKDTEGRFFSYNVLPADLIEDGNSYRLYLEMPGMTPKSVEVKVEQGELVVEGERKQSEWPAEAHVLLAERRHGKIRRTFVLPEDVSSGGVKASYRDGVLEVIMPKRPEAKPIKISVEH
jgi:HSP20 family protein